jgi:hypothetical protein
VLYPFGELAPLRCSFSSGTPDTGSISCRPFFQICSVGDIPPSVAFLFSNRLGGGGGAGYPSSSESSVKSITSLARDCDCVCGTDVFSKDWFADPEEPRRSEEGDSSRFTLPSSSSSESKTNIPSPTASADSLMMGADGWGTGFSTAGAGCVVLQTADAKLSSDVCHSPFDSTITSSTLSGVDRRMSSKYLQIK